MKILITGGCGFIGSAMCRYLIKNTEATVFNLDSLTYASSIGALASIIRSSRYYFVKGDINDTQLVLNILKENNITGIIHFAAESHVDRSIAEPEKFLETNIIGTFSLLQAVRTYLNINRKMSSEFRFLHISTDEIYGDLTDSAPAFTEGSIYNPSSPYSASKAASNHLVKAWGRTFDIPVMITNSSNNYGPYQFPEKLIPVMILNAISGNLLPVYGDGLNVRDWLHVEDHCRGIELVFRQGKIGRDYNIGGNSEQNNLHITKLICKILDEVSPRNDCLSYLSQIEFVKDRLGHDRRYALNYNRIEKELGWSPQLSFESGLRNTINWYLENRAWWEPIWNERKIV